LKQGKVESLGRGEEARRGRGLVNRNKRGQRKNCFHLKGEKRRKKSSSVNINKGGN